MGTVSSNFNVQGESIGPFECELLLRWFTIYQLCLLKTKLHKPLLTISIETFLDCFPSTPCRSKSSAEHVRSLLFMHECFIYQPYSWYAGCSI